MNNTTLQLKIKERLNKLASDDYDNIEKWQMVEAFNKAQLTWCRRQLHGMNQFKEGDEGSKRRIDDLQILLKEIILPLDDRGLYCQSKEIPADYFEWKRITADAGNECCPNKRRMVIYLAEEANVDSLLNDYNKKPSYEWGETFCTLIGNKVRIYTNADFKLDKATLEYYRMPVMIEIAGSTSPNTNKFSTKDVECEFKDDIAELMIDEAVKILAGDIESFGQEQIAEKNVESNN